jgi:hypothetical protein
MRRAGNGPVEIPDLPSPIVAWRIWRVGSVKGRYRLVSMFKWSAWQPEQPLAAECLRTPWLIDRLLRRRPHGAPDPQCECGIYGAELALLDTCLSAADAHRELGMVVGEVSLWGTVIECEHGYRGSLAYPRRIYIPTDSAGGRPDDLAEGLSAYRVPVELLPVGYVGAAGELMRRIIAA